MLWLDSGHSGWLFWYIFMLGTPICLLTGWWSPSYTECCNQRYKSCFLTSCPFAVVHQQIASTKANLAAQGKANLIGTWRQQNMGLLWFFSRIKTQRNQISKIQACLHINLPLLVWSINSLAVLCVYVACRSVSREVVTGDMRKTFFFPG